MRIEVEELAKAITPEFNDYCLSEDLHPRIYNYYSIVDDFIGDYLFTIEEKGLNLTEEEKDYISNSLIFEE